MDGEFHCLTQPISYWLWTSSWIVWCCIGLHPAEEYEESVSRKLLRRLSACWTFPHDWYNVSPSTRPISQDESNPVVVARGAELGSVRATPESRWCCVCDLRCDQT